MTTVFRPRPLPAPVAHAVHARLHDAHRQQPFSTVDVRETAGRVTRLLGDLPVQATIYRGGLDLCGIEVDHMWVAVAGEEPPAEAHVLDAAFPLFEARFVDALRRFVVGEADDDELEALAVTATLDARVLGVFPTPMRYLGEPVWSQRQGGAY